jgi:hypothetical protein
VIGNPKKTAGFRINCADTSNYEGKPDPFDRLRAGSSTRLRLGRDDQKVVFDTNTQVVLIVELFARGASGDFDCDICFDGNCCLGSYCVLRFAPDDVKQAEKMSIFL